MVAVLEFFNQGCVPITPQLADLLSEVGAQVGRVVARDSAAVRLNPEVLHDALTDLPNRRLFKKRVERALINARDDRHQVAVLVLDLEWFKTINDSLGHDIGDGILLEVADRLGGCMRPGDTVARLGGDQFAFLLADVSHGRDGRPLANRILDVLRLPFRAHDTLLAIQGSIGIALSDPHQPDTADHLLRNAELAMYRAKAGGRGQVLAFTPAMHESARLRLERGGELPRALAAGEFAVHYQPKISLKSGQVTGTEALVRWNHPHHGLMPPIECISIAEETGVVVALGEWVLNQACTRPSRGKGLPQAILGLPSRSTCRPSSSARR